MDRYADADAKNGAVTLFFRDHQGETIRTAVARVRDYVAQNPIEKAEYLLAGGLVGVLAAVNEVILAGQIEAIDEDQPFALWLDRGHATADVFGARLALRDRSPLVEIGRLKQDPHLEMHTRGG